MKAAQRGQSLSVMNPDQVTADCFVWPKAVLSLSDETPKPPSGSPEPEALADQSFYRPLLHQQ